MRIVPVIAFAALALTARAEVVCPDSLEVQQRAVAPSNDWTVSYTAPPLRLVGITLYDGPPSQGRKVKPFSVRRGKRELRVSWRLGESRRNFHLVCGYERTTASLVTVLPPGVKGCNAVFDRRVSSGDEEPAVKRMVCS